MIEKINHPLTFHPERLQVLSAYLRNQKKNRSFKVLEDDNHLFNSEDDPVNLFPVYECVISSLPKAFPDDWVASDGTVVFRRSDRRVCLLSSIIIYFGLDVDQFMHLFTPYAQEPDQLGGHFLDRDATPEDIAYNISEMICFYELAMQLHPDIKIFIRKN